MKRIIGFSAITVSGAILMGFVTLGAYISAAVYQREMQLFDFGIPFLFALCIYAIGFILLLIETGSEKKNKLNDKQK